jgi:hypothetical protein
VILGLLHERENSLEVAESVLRQDWSASRLAQ